MKKRIIICVTCMAVAGLYANAQTKVTTITTNDSFVAAPPPPPPPPAPPAPPVPPIPPVIDFAYDCDEPAVIEIVNNNGNEISVITIKGIKTVLIKQEDGKKVKIKLSTWNANRKYYEKKYGQLPPPPPPGPVVEEVQFTPPVIEKESQ